MIHALGRLSIRLVIVGAVLVGTYAPANGEEISTAKICKAGIGVVMGRDPNIMKTDAVRDEVVYISYVRADDGTRWAYKCKVEGNRIIWGNDDGRWRTHELDSKVFFKIADDTIAVEDRFGDGSASRESFKLSRIPR